MSTSVMAVTPRTTTIEARNRRSRYLASIRLQPYSGGSPSSLLAVRHPNLGVPRPLGKLVEGAEVGPLDARVDAIDSAVEQDDRRRLQVGHEVLELEVQRLALGLVDCTQRLVQQLVCGVV